jgi:hypothetical protein
MTQASLGFIHRFVPFVHAWTVREGRLQQLRAFTDTALLAHALAKDWTGRASWPFSPFPSNVVHGSLVVPIFERFVPINHETFCSSTSRPHHRLQYPRATFDEVNTLSVKGLNKSAIAWVKSIAWNAVHRWLQSRT